MKRVIAFALILLISVPATWAQAPVPAANNDTQQMQQQINELKKQISALEARLNAQDESAKDKKAETPVEGTVSVTELKDQVKELDQRVGKTERRSALDRLQWSGDFRVETNSIFGNVPTHYDGMQVQNLMVKSLWFAGQNGITPGQMAGMLSAPTLPNGQPNTPANFAALVNGAVANNYGGYQFFTNNLTYKQLQQMVSGFTPQQMAGMQQYLQNVPGVLIPAYSADTNVLMTNRLRLNFDAQVADNVTVGARLSMFKTFGDSTNAQVFNGQPNSFDIDGTTSRVPTGDMVRVERAFFTWKDIGGSKLYLSVGRRPSTDGPPMNFKEDEPRGGTPAGSLFDFQYDGMTLGYHITDKMTARACYGMGYTSGFGNANVLKSPADRLKDVHLFGAMVDLIETDNTFVQALAAHAWNVTDGFNGQIVLPNNPLTGDAINAPVIMRYTPSANLGGINLYGLTMQRRFKQFDTFFTANVDSLRPNGESSPFGGLGSDPFQVPTDHNGYMFYAGVRYSIPQDDGRTKIGFEFNHGSKYWFNFAQAEDDVFAPKTSARGEVYETYLTHRINPHFILRAGYQRFNYTWSGSGWHVGAPKRLDSIQVLGFPSYDTANVLTVGMTARF